jgi:transposase
MIGSDLRSKSQNKRQQINALLLNSIMKTSKKYDWKIIQADYNSGLSQRELVKKYGMSSKTLYVATLNGDLISRTKSDSVALGNAKFPRTHSKEFKEKQRKNIIERYEAGWMPKAGRCKKYKYISKVAGEVLLDGTWELAVAKWLDSKNYNWKRNTKRFPYTNLKNTLSHYTPDFWVEELGGYLEVKGYETKLDRCKWEQFTEPLTVWKKKDLKDIL